MKQTYIGYWGHGSEFAVPMLPPGGLRWGGVGEPGLVA